MPQKKYYDNKKRSSKQDYLQYHTINNCAINHQVFFFFLTLKKKNPTALNPWSIHPSIHPTKKSRRWKPELCCCPPPIRPPCPHASSFLNLHMSMRNLTQIDEVPECRTQNRNKNQKQEHGGDESLKTTDCAKQTSELQSATKNCTSYIFFKKALFVFGHGSVLHSSFIPRWPSKAAVRFWFTPRSLLPSLSSDCTQTSVLPELFLKIFTCSE